MRPVIPTWRRVACSLVVLTCGVACSSEAEPPSAAPSSDAGVWYETSLDPDTSYLPMGSVAYEKVPFSWTSDDDGPVSADGYVPKGDQAPVVVFLPGAGIVKERYYWLGNALASHGFATFIVQPPGDFSNALLSTSLLGALRTSPELARRVDLGRVVLAGHSVGSAAQGGLTDVSSCSRALCPPGASMPDGVRALVLLGYHNQANPADAAPMPAIDAPWLVLAGTRDGVSTPEKVSKTFERIVDRPLYRVEVEGMNHYQLTDYVKPGADQLDVDGTPSIGNKAARAAAATYVVAFLRRTILGDASIPEDLDAPRDGRVKLTTKRARFAVSGGSLPRLVRDPLGRPGLSDKEGNCDVAAAEEYKGSLYFLTRNEVDGAEVWRVTGRELARVPFPNGVTNGIYGNRQINALFGAMAVFKGKLWVGFSSGVQGNVRGSTGSELWTYDGETWAPVISNKVREGVPVQITGISGCDGSSANATFTVAGASWAADEWKGARLDDVDAGTGAALVWTVTGNGPNTLTATLDERATGDNLLDCAALPVADATRSLAVGATLRLRRGDDLPGFGDPWNKALTSLAVYGDKLYAATGLNYRRGAEIYVTSDGVSFTRAVTSAQLAVDGATGVTSSSITAMRVAEIEGTPKLYFSAVGNGGYGARLFALDSQGELEPLVDKGGGRTGLATSGFGRALLQIPSMAVFNKRLWLGAFSGSGLQILSASKFGPSHDIRVEVGDDAATPTGFGDPNQIVARLDVAGGRLWAGATLGSSSASDLKEQSALWWQSGDGSKWQLASAHAFGNNQISTSRIIGVGETLYALTGSGALTARSCIAPARVYVLHDEAPTSPR